MQVPGSKLGSIACPPTSMVDHLQDEGEMRYWADNMFAANHWESHCSALGSNVHIIGLLLVR